MFAMSAPMPGASRRYTSAPTAFEPAPRREARRRRLQGGTTMAAQGGGGEDLAALVERLSEQVGRLVREELELARRELADKGREAAAGAALVGAAGAMGAGAFAIASAGLVRVAGRVLPRSLAPFAVAGLYGGAAAALGREGLRRIQDAGPFVPQEAVE